MRRRVSIGGLSVSIEVDGDGPDGDYPDHVDVLLQLLAGCAPSDPHVEPALKVTWSPVAPDAPEDEPDAASADVRLWMREEGVVVVHRSGLTGWVDGSVLRLGGRPDETRATRPWRIALQLPLCQLLGRTGRHVAHAGLIGTDAGLLLLVGPSGSGKSTTAYAAALAGWEVLADDLSIIACRPDPVAWGFPKPLHVPGELLTDEPVDGVELADDSRARVAVPVPGEVAVEERALRGIVYLGHADARGATAPAPSGTSAVQELMGAFPIAYRPWGSRQVFGTAAALARLPATRLLLDADPQRRMAGVVLELERCLSSWSTDPQSMH